MRTRLLVLPVVVLLAAPQLRAAEDAKVIIEKAIRAHGGKEKLARLNSVYLKAKGTLKLDSETPFLLETFWQEPGRLKKVITLNPDKPDVTVETFAGDDSWSRRNDRIAPLLGVKRDNRRADAHLRRIVSLTPLLHDKIYELSVLEQIRIGDKSAAGVGVSCPGERDVKLYFNAETGRLAKIERRIFDELTKKLVRQEEFLSDYRDMDGVATATKLLWRRDGKKHGLKLTVTEARYPKRFDTDVFADPRSYRQQRDVIYGRKPGVALTMDVFTPKKGTNGAAIIYMVSGGWFSDRAQIDTEGFWNSLNEPIHRGYTVFAVCHGSQRLYTVADAIADVNRAVRFIRYHARDYGINPRRIGVTGGSAGGHLSLMLGVAGNDGDSQSSDAVERTSSRVQAVACFFPPTDFLNYGAAGKAAFTADGILANLRSAVDVRQFDKQSKRLEHIDDKDKFEKLCRDIAPTTFVTAKAAPTLIIHGDADRLVPMQQSEIMIERLKKAGVPTRLVVKKGADHGWADMDKDRMAFYDWFDKYLGNVVAYDGLGSK